MSTDLNALITATDKEAQYDECAKQLLGRKIILAHILKYTIDEFKGLEPEEITYLIEGEPYINKVPVDPGCTNTTTTSDNEKITGFNTDNQELNEGLIKFDIIFYVRMREGLSRIIVNVEAQKDEPSEYYILNRGIFYGCRMISSQKEREFKKSDYNDIKQIYSIWICMNMDQNSLNHIHLTNDRIMGSHEWKGDLDLLNIVFIGLTNNLPPQEEIYILHRFLGAIFSTDCSVEQKITVLEDEYGLLAREDIREEVKLMCNLSQGIREEGWKAGLSEGRAEGRAESFTEIFSNMYKKGYTLEQIAEITDKPLAEIKTFIRSQQPLTIVSK